MMMLRTDCGDVTVSTVSLGREFETMVFPSADGVITDWGDVYCERHDSETAALAAHAFVVYDNGGAR